MACRRFCSLSRWLSVLRPFKFHAWTRGDHWSPGVEMSARNQECIDKSSPETLNSNLPLAIWFCFFSSSVRRGFSSAAAASLATGDDIFQNNILPADRHGMWCGCEWDGCTITVVLFVKHQVIRYQTLPKTKTKKKAREICGRKSWGVGGLSTYPDARGARRMPAR